MDSRFGFLSEAESDLLGDVLHRRDPALARRLRRSGSVSASDAAGIVSILGDELIDNLDDEWEPTDYGRTVSLFAESSPPFG